METEIGKTEFDLNVSLDELEKEYHEKRLRRYH